MSIIKTVLSDRKTFAASVVVALVIIVVFAVVIARQNRLASQMKAQQGNLEKISKEGFDLKQKYVTIQNDFNKLQQDYQAISVDRDNLLIQIKKLAADRDRAAQLEESVKKNVAAIETLTKDRKELDEQLMSQKKANLDLEAARTQLVAEKDQLAQQLQQARDQATYKRLDQENKSVKKDNDALNRALKEQQEQVARLKKSQDELAQESKELKAKLAQYEKDYATAVDKNRAFERKVNDQPANIAEISRQNQVLTRQNAAMHYNLGVFYTKHRDYGRAASEFEKAIEIDPTNAYAHFNLGYIYAEYLVNRTKAIAQFKDYLRYVNAGDKDIDWVKRYIVTWQTWGGGEPMK